MRDVRAKASTVALIGSLTVHGLVATWLWTHSDARHNPPAPPPIQFTLFEPLPGSIDTSPPAEPIAVLEPRDEKIKRIREKNVAAARPEAHVEPSVLAVERVATDEATPNDNPSLPQPAQPAITTERRPRGAIDLSPLAAALTMRDTLGSVGRCEAALSGSAAGCEGEADGKTAPATPALAAGPRRDALNVAGEIKLDRQADGSFAYNGTNFYATVAPDGRVSFDDKVRDLNSLVERHIVGLQINTTEKRRFMESTAALRDRLADAAEALNQKRAKVALAAKLNDILRGAAPSLQQKRSAIFALWDDCASDESGNAAQAAIETFVRERLPENTALAYGAAELDQLNRRRASRRLFDPYGATDAGVRPG